MDGAGCLTDGGRRQRMAERSCNRVRCVSRSHARRLARISKPLPLVRPTRCDNAIAIRRSLLGPPLLLFFPPSTMIIRCQGARTGCFWSRRIPCRHDHPLADGRSTASFRSKRASQRITCCRSTTLPLYFSIHRIPAAKQSKMKPTRWHATPTGSVFRGGMRRC